MEATHPLPDLLAHLRRPDADRLHEGLVPQRSAMPLGATEDEDDFSDDDGAVREDYDNDDDEVTSYDDLDDEEDEDDMDDYFYGDDLEDN